jgi:ubiquinone/menaquinone biosynthesis C-methylase UbiE
MKPKKNSHYSYSIYDDSNFAGQFDASHFGGEVGRLIVERQARVLLDFLGEPCPVTALDVGTGTGRAAFAITKAGVQVTGMDASREMLNVARAHALENSIVVNFLPGDAHALPFADRSFDAVTSLRMLMHTPDWRRCIREMCRVARRRVIFDYPPLVSFAALQTGMRRAAQWTGRRVETYHVIPTHAARSVLQANGFEIIKMDRQFVLPIAFHKWIGSARFTNNVERGLAVIGLLRWMGSPVTILAERI